MNNSTVSLEELFSKIHNHNSSYTKFVFTYSVLLKALLKAGYIELIDPPEVFEEQGWELGKFYVITEIGRTILEFSEL